MEKWDINRTQYSISDFLDWQRKGNLELSPSFQRRPVWDPSAKSYLIDTIVRGLPIPIIFVREKTDLTTLTPKKVVVDGQQRLRTVLSYIDPKCLPDYQEKRDFFEVKKSHNKELAGKKFFELDDEYKNRIVDYKFSVHVLPSNVDDRQVLQIFARMNATGVKLNDQELRNAQYFGEFKQAMYTLAYEQLSRWREWGIFTEDHIARMQEVEFTSDLVLMIMRGISKKTREVLNNFYKDYDDEFKEKDVVAERFHVAMDTIDDNWGELLLNSAFKRKPLFYILFTLVYSYQFGLSSPLVKAHKKSLPPGFSEKICRINENIEKKQLPSDILEAINSRTTDAAFRQRIFKYFLGLK